MDRFQFDFKNQVCFVTGASSGIGRATAIAFAQKGAKVACVDINEVGGKETASHIQKIGGQSLFSKCDVSKSSDVQAAVRQTVETFGSLDVAFNNAGTEGHAAPLTDWSEENWDQVLDINLKGVWLCMKFQIPQMLKQGRGSIINCASIAGVVGFQNSAAYVASKHGIVGLTKTAALEYAKSNIRVNAVCPGVIQTAMIDRYVQGDEKVRALLSAGEPMGRMGVPDEIASAVLWLGSEGASFVTGHALVVDGGWVAQ